MSKGLSYSALLVELFKTGRPLTGLYGFLLSFVGFKFFDWQDWQLGVGVGFLTAFIVMSTMRFNDIVDAENDKRKGKLFASKHQSELTAFWFIEACLIASGLTLLTVWDFELALFCLGAWVIGSLYSFVPHWYVFQNILVAISSSVPILCAMIHFHKFEIVGLNTFVVLVVLIWVSEIHKDVEDQETDVGYKKTFPTQVGHRSSMLITTATVPIIAALLAIHPTQGLILVAVTLLPKLAYEQVIVLQNSGRIDLCFNTVNQIIFAIGVVLYIT